MQVFAIFSLSNPAQVLDRIKKEYEDDFLALDDDTVFLIATEGETTQDVGESIGLGEDALSRGIIARVTSYWGRHSPGTWEWIGVKMESNGE